MNNLICGRCSRGSPYVTAIGNTIFCACGWEGPVDPVAAARRRFTKKALLLTVAAIFVSILGYLGIQFHRWGPYTGNYVLTHAKALVGLAQPLEWQNLGMACEITERWQCMDEAFEKVLSKIPDQEYALESKGVAKVKKGDYKSAVAQFEGIIKRGEAPVRTMFYYAKALQGLDRTEESMGWLYGALKTSPGNVDVAGELIELLVKQEKYSEAITIINNMAALYPEADKYFSGRMASLYELASKQNTRPAQKSFRVAALGAHHFVPVRFAGMTSAAMFMVDTGATSLMLNTGFMRKHGIRDFQVLRKARFVIGDGSILEGVHILIPKMSIGPWELTDVEASYCDSCAMVVGKSVLKRFQLASHVEKGVEYLELRK